MHALIECLGKCVSQQHPEGPQRLRHHQAGAPLDGLVGEQHPCSTATRQRSTRKPRERPGIGVFDGRNTVNHLVVAMKHCAERGSQGGGRQRSGREGMQGAHRSSSTLDARVAEMTLRLSAAARPDSSATSLTCPDSAIF